MAKLSTTELLDAFKELTLIELSEFIKEFETTFGVTAAAPVAAAAAAPAAAGGDAGAAEEEGSDEVDVILEAAGEKKIQVIKEVRSLTSLGPQGGQGSGRGRTQGRYWRRSTRRLPTRLARPLRLPGPRSRTSSGEWRHN